MKRRKENPNLEAYEHGAVIGSAEGIERLLAEPPDGPAPEDPDSRYLLQLVGLHPELQINLRTEEIDGMTVQTKRTLIKDIQRMLGIKPLRCQQQ